MKICYENPHVVKSGQKDRALYVKTEVPCSTVSDINSP